MRFARTITYLLRHRIGNFGKGNKGNLHKKDWLNFSVCKVKSRQFPQAIHMPTSWHFLKTTAHQAYIIKCRNKHVQSAVLMLIA